MSGSDIREINGNVTPKTLLVGKIEILVLLTSSRMNPPVPQGHLLDLLVVFESSSSLVYKIIVVGVRVNGGANECK